MAEKTEAQPAEDREPAPAEDQEKEYEKGKAKGRRDEKSAEGEETREKKEELPDADDADTPAPVAVLDRLQDVVYYGIAVILLLAGATVTVVTASDFITQDDSFAHRVSDVVNGVLFVVIVLELLRTVLAHFEDDTFHLKPFMIIGIVSVVRHILTVGAEISLEEEGGSELFHRSDIELAINAGVVLLLVIGLVLVRETE